MKPDHPEAHVTGIRPAFYALSSGSWRDYVTLLHLPYTLWHLSYVVLGAAAALELHLGRTGLTVLAFFLAVGVGAHALDELQGRPLRTRIGDLVLQAIAGITISASLGIGALLTIQVGAWTALFVAAGGFLVVAYNMELLNGRFHSDTWFALSWGAFPALVGYWVNAGQLDIKAGLVATACMALSLAQRALSSQARMLRREALRVVGQVEYKDGRVDEIDVPRLLAAPEKALRMLGLSVPLLALGLLAAKL